MTIFCTNGIVHWVIPEKIHIPTTEGMVFYPPLPHGFLKLLEPPSPLDFQVQRPPPQPIWISIKFLHTIILIYTQCRRILLGTWKIFLLNKSQFSVFVVKVKIPFSHLLKQAYTFANYVIFV